MNAASFQFHAGLNDFLPAAHREARFLVHFKGTPSVKHLAEALGAPHTEIGAVRVNGAPVGFPYRVQDGDRVDLFPPSLGEDGLQPGADEPGFVADANRSLVGRYQFVADNHLGRLAVSLRMLGFDTLYRNDYQDMELAQTSAHENRILLTRDIRLLMRKIVRRGYWVRSLDPSQQIREVLARYRLASLAQPLHRCIRCNGILEPVAKEAVFEQLEPKTKLYYTEFRRCLDCGQVYWKGSHFERMEGTIRGLLEDGGGFGR